MVYLPSQKIVKQIIAEDEDHDTSKQLCQQYQAKRIMSIELNLTREIEEMGRSADDVYVGLYNCEKKRYKISKHQLDFARGEEFTYAEGIRHSLKVYNQLVR